MLQGDPKPLGELHHVDAIQERKLRALDGDVRHEDKCGKLMNKIQNDGSERDIDHGKLNEHEPAKFHHLVPTEAR